MTDDLRKRIDDAIRPVMLLGLEDADLSAPGGTERIGEWADWISKTVADLIQTACAECGHPEGEHREADEPVSVGLYATCDKSGSDDAHHNYQPAEEQQS
ncbi:hypothetical protein [Streptomyces sp. NPDC093589]|uniref:hypothetical protein n=1 Tax=Streptomyces sp. NPDC093589 TaxID=3366043 RepID=UPI0037F323D7